MVDKVIDANVQTIINQPLSQQVARPGETVVRRVARSFRSLQKRRREADPLNIHLVAAEHYMYARFVAGTSGDPSLKAAPALYGLKKRLCFALGIEEEMATIHNRVLSPSNDVERWGPKGGGSTVRRSPGQATRTPLPLHHAPGDCQRTAQAQSCRPSRAPAQEPLARRHHPYRDVAVAVHAAPGRTDSASRGCI